MTHELTLVLGGTGKTGRRVAARLDVLGRPVRIGSRTADPAFDWNKPATWPGALDGVGSVYVTYYPDLGFPGAAEVIGAFAGTAVAAGARRLVLLSGRGEEEVLPAEQAIRDCGAEWTILRASWFAQNFSEHFLLESVRAGVIALPAPDVAEPFIDVEDIADVAVAALTGREHAGKDYELTGPRLLTFTGIAAEFSAVLGRTVRFLPLRPEEYAAAAVQDGMPVEEAGPLAEMFARVLDGRNSYLTDDVERILGRPAQDFSDYLADTARIGVWAIPERSER
ncbi:MAG TPA: NmrA family NAD(P)-binding protein [Mycobacteriales bacterium]|nr:NmrA family NAD(P)-binding protein [Mycobacteriales bacterium]